MNVLFLDDDSYRTHLFRSQVPSALCVETSAEAIAALGAYPHWDYVWLDHDLGGEEGCDSELAGTGMEVVRWIVANKPSIGRVLIHTLNPAAQNRMFDALFDARYHALIVPFGWKYAGASMEQLNAAKG